MENDIIGQITDVLVQTRDEIRANMDAKKINASGRTSASLRVERWGNKIVLVGGNNQTHTVHGDIYGSDTAPIPTLEVGRKGGKVPRGFFYIIREWSREKGLNFANESERNTFAGIVAHKIASEGTKRYMFPADVYSTPVEKAKERIEKIANENVRKTIRDAIGGIKVSTIATAFG